jgi:hypothetical protein
LKWTEKQVVEIADHIADFSLAYLKSLHQGSSAYSAAITDIPTGVR